MNPGLLRRQVDFDPRNSHSLQNQAHHLIHTGTKLFEHQRFIIQSCSPHMPKSANSDFTRGRSLVDMDKLATRRRERESNYPVQMKATKFQFKDSTPPLYLDTNRT
ncbi:hypothetical protein CEXT_512311 [Caerostris extrusa]|uniref:Uncharacterized protein n=1 Tax=Caerostris extrusa TaxID=172846 RepID=A0AAV4TF38_CAEEX|nr:hypothetical protein CEXT_512311 [Caerostris extrusa]